MEIMESEILKFICANQGAVNTDVLVYDLGSANVPEIIANREKFVPSCVDGQPRVVARTGLKLCRVKDCPGTCRGLHLCKNFLFSGSCHYMRSRRGCSFSHELSSEHNVVLLQQHGLESLSRSELCTLLLQNDNTLLPPICFDYNNGAGEFGRCQEGNECKRMHICQVFLKRDCSCIRAHDFFCQQPLKSLRDKGVPQELIGSLKAVYANKEALRRFYKGNQGNDASGGRGRGRGRGGHRGSRGNRGMRGNQARPNPGQRAASSSDIVSDLEFLDLYTAGGMDVDDPLNSSTSDVSAAADDTDVSSEGGRSKSQTPNDNKNRSRRRRHGHSYEPVQKNAFTNEQSSSAGDKDANCSNDQPKRWGKKLVKDKTEICMYFIKGHCKHEDKCFKAHDKMPYRWQVREGDEWKALPDNEGVEKDYCDPKNTYSSGGSPVCFDTMTRGTSPVRRLSTVNSLREPTFIHTTEWLWYWEDEFGSWKPYASNAGHRAADIDSAFLEQKFLDNDKDVVEFTAGSQSYRLSFQDMIQTNKHYGTKRLVKRRPRFVSAEDVQEKRVRRPLGPAFAPLPDHWDKKLIPATGYQRISLQRSSEEYKEVEALFCKTMIGFDIVQIDRIQNKSLWEVYQWQKNQMKNNNNGRTVKEQKLFHGTDSKYVDAICSTNFDWRICGTHGTAFGKGSYFARDAKYSHSYTDNSDDVKTMFVSRVLVGDYARGSPDYRRPPSKDGGDVNFFDSCVDNVHNPSIFVVFEKHQIYPEYLLRYKTSDPFFNLYSGGSVAATRPTPQPRVSVSQPSRNSYRPSASGASAYASSTSLYVSSSFNPPTSLSNQPSTRPYQYQPRQPTPSPPSPPKKSDSCAIA